MDGDARVRFCGECEQHVYNLSTMTETEARRLVAEREGSVCVRFYRREDGTVLTSDCVVGQKRSFLRAAGRALTAVAAVSAGLSALSGCADDYDSFDDDEPLPTGVAMMGSLPVRGDSHADGDELDYEGQVEEIMGEAVLPAPDVLMGRIARPVEDE